MERVAELLEARQMAGAGPWAANSAVIAQTDSIIQEAYSRFGKGSQPLALRESVVAPGGFDLDLLLQSQGWRREIAGASMEFTRWGIQQIILITRLRYMKNPIMRRLINVRAAYIFARGVELSSPDPDANEQLKRFRERNKATLGQVALTAAQRRKSHDGNLFWALFADRENTGEVDCRLIDAVEIQEVVKDPEDSTRPWFYLRVWSQKVFDSATGQTKAESQKRWYPAVGYTPTEKPLSIGGTEVAWDSPVYHRKCGGIDSWDFGVPEMYAAGDWANESKRYLERCASVMHALGEIARTVTTKGGQQAVAGVKQQMETGVDPYGGSIWDPNPPATGGTFVAGTGTTIEAFKTQGSGLDPEKVAPFVRMACMVADVPETFVSILANSNLATATSLDRPTETAFLEQQAAWQEDLVSLGAFALQISNGATNGKLKEARRKRHLPSAGLEIRECAREYDSQGRWHYVEAAAQPGVIEVRADFPAIREGDIPALVTATVEAMTLGNHGGQIIGIDAKEGTRKLGEILGINNNDEMVEKQYPETGNPKYDPNRLTEILPAPIPKAQPLPGGKPEPQPADMPETEDAEKHPAVQ